STCTGITCLNRNAAGCTDGSVSSQAYFRRCGHGSLHGACATASVACYGYGVGTCGVHRNGSGGLSARQPAISCTCTGITCIKGNAAACTDGCISSQVYCSRCGQGNGISI